MKFQRHIVPDIYDKARWIGGPITPDLLVLHDTASRLKAGSVEDYLKNNSAKTSVHFIVAMDGKITQQVPVNRRANHAGTSHYHGRDRCNDFSIGIEFTNPGFMTLNKRTGKARAWWGSEFDIDLFNIERVSTPMHGDHYWMPHTEAQIDAVLRLGHTLFDYVPTLKDVRAHWYISPGRKVDVNPLFPLEQIRSQLLGREEPSEDEADAQAHSAEFDEWVTIGTPGDTLNMRRWPSFNPNVIAAIPDGTVVPVVSRGSFDGREWTKVVYAGEEGWVVSRYISEAEVFE